MTPRTTNSLVRSDTALGGNVVLVVELLEVATPTRRVTTLAERAIMQASSEEPGLNPRPNLLRCTALSGPRPSTR